MHDKRHERERAVLLLGGETHRRHGFAQRDPLVRVPHPVAALKAPTRVGQVAVLELHEAPGATLASAGTRQQLVEAVVVALASIL